MHVREFNFKIGHFHSQKCEAFQRLRYETFNRNNFTNKLKYAGLSIINVEIMWQMRVIARLAERNFFLIYYV